MCLIFAAWKTHEEYPLILLANRDEFKNRPTEKLHWWNEEIIAGKDLQEGGTWLGLDKSGRLAAVTNFRDPKNIKSTAPSRGQIPLNFLTSKESAQEFIEQQASRWLDYNGFNGLLFDKNSLLWWSNYAKAPEALKPGFYGLSNALLNTPWPKLVKGKNYFEQWVKHLPKDIEKGFDLMGNTQIFPDEYLPDTGVGIVMERYLSSICIPGEIYGTRSTTMVLIRKDGNISVRELNRSTNEMINYEFATAPFNVSVNL
jgi:uncharacterized protein with NRDE domain